MDRITMKIDGMSCGNCVSHVRKALEGLDGVQVEQVNIGSATVAYDPRVASEAAIARVIEDEGYPVRSAAR
jgi:copper chaperone